MLLLLLLPLPQRLLILSVGRCRAVGRHRLPAVAVPPRWLGGSLGLAVRPGVWPRGADGHVCGGPSPVLLALLSG